MRLIFRTLLAVALLGAVTQAGAASIGALTVKEANGRYVIEMRAHLNVPAKAAYAVFADLDDLTAINGDLRRMKVIGRSPDGAVELYTEFRACVLWYCRAVREIQEMTFVSRSDGGEVDAAVLPRTGDFRYGRARWVFRSSGEQTDLDVAAELQPSFRIPPFIGPWLVRRWLRMETERASANIERLARLPVTSSDARMAR